MDKDIKKELSNEETGKVSGGRSNFYFGTYKCYEHGEFTVRFEGIGLAPAGHPCPECGKSCTIVRN